MLAREKENASLRGGLPKEYARPAINSVMLGELTDLISGITLGESHDKSRDVLGRVYEYFLGQFAGSKGKRGGEFDTPRSVVGPRLRPLLRFGGMFVQAERFLETHGGRLGDIAVHG